MEGKKPTLTLTESDITQYERDGYLIKRKLYSQQEMDLLLAACKSDKDLQDNHLIRKDTTGKVSKLSMWSHPGDDLYGMFARSERLVTAIEQLLHDEVYHYHSKVMLKEPLVGGAWEWHQDYGYWYKNGCLYPNMVSAMIAIDKADKENGCLQVLKGSHYLGRINHGVTGDQQGAEMVRVEAAIKLHELVYGELEPGDVFFLHCNTLHTSAANTSTRPRWSYIIAYNAKSNNPLFEHHHPFYTPLHKVPDTSILEKGIVTHTKEYNRDNEAYKEDK